MSDEQILAGEAAEVSSLLSLAVRFDRMIEVLRVPAIKKLLREFDRLQRSTAAAAANALAERDAAIAEAAEIKKAASASAAEILGSARQEREGIDIREQQLVIRENRINRLEAAWRFVGEDENVARGFRAPEFSALQKYRAAKGLPPIDEPNVSGLEPADAEPVRVDVLSDVSDDPTRDRHGVPLPSGLTRDVSHKQRRQPAGEVQ